MLREMTSSALAHSFKRFAQCAVAGLALAGLAACGGGGSSTPAATAPTTPTPSNPTEIPVTPAAAAFACFSTRDDDGGPQFCAEYPSGTKLEGCPPPDFEDQRVQQLQQCPRSSGEYGLITECRYPEGRPGGGSSTRFNHFIYYPRPLEGSLDSSRMICEDNEGTTFHIHQQPTSSPAPAPAQEQYVSISFGQRISGSSSRYGWASRTGTSASAAASNARTACENRLGSACQSTLPGHTGCSAIAISACPAGCLIPAAGIAGRATRQDAQAAAIGECRRRASSAGQDGSTCRIATGDNSNPGVLCGSAAQ